MKTIIFDFDGTIADSFPFVFEIVKELAPKYGYEPLKVEEIELLRELSFQEIIKKYNIGPVKLVRMTLDAHAANARRMTETKLFSGMVETLKGLKHEGYQLAIMSSNSKKNILSFLSINKLDMFDNVDTSISLFGKGKKLQRIIKKLGLKNSDVIYVGDEARDIDAAKEAGIRIISVDWGYNKPEILKENNDIVVSSPAELKLQIEKSFK